MSSIKEIGASKLFNSIGQLRRRAANQGSNSAKNKLGKVKLNMAADSVEIRGEKTLAVNKQSKTDKSYRNACEYDEIASQVPWGNYC